MVTINTSGPYSAGKAAGIFKAGNATPSPKEKVFCVSFIEKPCSIPLEEPTLEAAKKELYKNLKQLIYGEDQTGNKADGWLDKDELRKIYRIQPNLLRFAPFGSMLFPLGKCAKTFLDEAYASLTENPPRIEKTSRGYMAIFKYS